MPRAIGKLFTIYNNVVKKIWLLAR